MVRPNPYVDGDLLDLAEMTARFAAERVAPGYVERDETRVLDRALSADMGELGLIAPELPVASGTYGAVSALGPQTSVHHHQGGWPRCSGQEQLRGKGHGVSNGSLPRRCQCPTEKAKNPSRQTPKEGAQEAVPRRSGTDPTK